MIDEKIDKLFDTIKNSFEYKSYIEIVNIIKKNNNILNLINEIKRLQKEATKLEYKKNSKYKELDKLINKKLKELNNIPEYIEYKSRMTELNNMLITSKNYIEEYLNKKI